MKKAIYSFLILSLCDLAGFSQAPASWTLRLRGDGHGPMVPYEYVSPQRHGGITFTSDGILFVSLRPKDRALTPRASNENADSYPVNLFRIDIQARAISATKLLSGNKYNNRMFATPGRHLILRSGNALQLYSEDLKLLSNLTLTDQGATAVTDVSSSPDAGVLAIAESAGNRSEVTILDTRNLHKTQTWLDSDLPAEFSISGSAIAAAYPQIKTSVVVKPFGPGPWKTIANQSRDIECISDPVFVSSEILLTGCRTLVLLRRDGSILLRHMLPKGFSISNEVSVSRSNSFAVLIQKYSTGIFDTAIKVKERRVLVFDLQALKMVCEIRVPSNEGPSSIALSPNGLKLAVLHGESVTVYSTQSLR